MWFNPLWLWRWLLHRLLKCQSLSTTVLWHTHEMTHGFKPFTDLKNFIVGSSPCQWWWNRGGWGCLYCQDSSVTVSAFHSQIIPSQIFPFYSQNAVHSFTVKLNVKNAFWFLRKTHELNTLISGHGLKACEKVWLYCRTNWLLSAAIWLGTIWQWNEVNGYHSDHWPSVWHHTFVLALNGQTFL